LGTNFSSRISPDQLFQADVEGWSCKPEADKVTMMRVQVARVSELGSSGTVFWIDGKHSVEATWLDSRNLLIECNGIPAGGETSKLDHWNEIKIYFKC